MGNCVHFSAYVPVVVFLEYRPAFFRLRFSIVPLSFSIVLYILIGVPCVYCSLLRWEILFDMYDMEIFPACVCAFLRSGVCRNTRPISCISMYARSCLLGISSFPGGIYDVDAPSFFLFLNVYALMHFPFSWICGFSCIFKKNESMTKYFN